MNYNPENPVHVFVQKKCVMAAHDCSLEEALKKDFKDGCFIRIKDGIEVINSRSDWFIEKSCLFLRLGLGGTWKHEDCAYNIIGLPPTLSRVFNALGDKIDNYNMQYVNMQYVGGRIDFIPKCDKLEQFSWELVHIFWNQEDHTQTEIAKLLGYTL